MTELDFQPYISLTKLKSTTCYTHKTYIHPKKKKKKKMKLACAITLLASSAAAFAPSNHVQSTTRLNKLPVDREVEVESPEEMSTVERGLDEVSQAMTDVTDMNQPKASESSQSLPFMNRPMALDGSLAGDVGFDPLGFAKTKDDLLTYREAEIKHARIAMLAAAGWPLSELWDRSLASMFGLDPVVDAANRAPSILNGGLGKVTPVYWVACLGAAAAIDLYQISKADSLKGDDNYRFPGDLKFDPLGLYPKDTEGQKRMQTAEIKNGRLAMIAITGFAVQEFVQGSAVVDQTPLFFQPFGGIF